MSSSHRLGGDRGLSRRKFLAATGGSAAAVALSNLKLPSAEAATTRQNLCTNPSLETNGASWSGLSSPTTAVVSEQSPPVGTDCLRVITDGSASFEGVYTATSVVTSSDVVTGSVYVKAPNGAAMRLRLEESNGMTIQTFTGTGAWQRVSVTRTLARSPVYAQLSVILNGSASITYYVDGCLLEKSATMGSYFDGDSPDTRWDGTAHASTSTLTSTAPVATTGSASEVTASSAMLAGSVDPNGAATAYSFEYGETISYGTSVPARQDGDAGSGGTPVAVDEDISGLDAATTYHYRLVASNREGTDSGDDETFATLPSEFTGNFDTGDTSEWDSIQAISERLTVVTSPKAQGTHAGRFEVQAGDREPQTGSQRCEVVSGLLFHEGDERYFRILARVDAWDTDAWGLIWQLHDESRGSPPVALFIEADELRLQNGTGRPVYWSGQRIATETWFEVVVRVVFSTREGIIEVWLNGRKQTLVGEVETLTNQKHDRRRAVLRQARHLPLKQRKRDGGRLPRRLPRHRGVLQFTAEMTQSRTTRPASRARDKEAVAQDRHGGPEVVERSSFRREPPAGGAAAPRARCKCLLCAG